MGRDRPRRSDRAGAGDQPREPQEPQEPQEDERATLYRVRLDYENFHVHREVGDGWPSTRDEIRWISGGQSDTRQHAVPFLSQEFGGHQTDRGQTPAFTGQRMAFNGDARLGLVLTVVCWEWDTGDGNDDSFWEAMNWLNENQLFTLIWDVIGSLAPDLIGYLMDLTSMAITVTNLIARNDLSSDRSLYLDQKALAALSHTGSAQWHFSGDGHHELKVKFTGDTIPFPAHDLQCVIRTGTMWSARPPCPSRA